MEFVLIKGWGIRFVMQKIARLYYLPIYSIIYLIVPASLDLRSYSVIMVINIVASPMA